MAAAAIATRLSAQRAEIRQVVSYLTLHNVTFESGVGVVPSSQLKLYSNGLGQLQQQSEPQPQPQSSQNTADQLLTAAATSYQQPGDSSLSSASNFSAALSNWTSSSTGAPPSSNSLLSIDFTLVWLGVFLAIPVLLLLLVCCLCINGKEDTFTKSLIDRDSESAAADDDVPDTKERPPPE